MKKLIALVLDVTVLISGPYQINADFTFDDNTGEVSETPTEIEYGEMVFHQVKQPSETEKKVNEEDLNESEIEPNTIVGNDNRYEVYNVNQFPMYDICYLRCLNDSGEYTTGTGIMIGDHTVVTAAHVLYDDTQNKWVESVQVFRGRTRNEKQLETLSAYSLSIPREFKNTSNPADDLGFIILNEPTGSNLVYPNVLFDSYQKGVQVTHYGYPVFNANHQRIRESDVTLYRVTGKVISIFSGLIDSDVDACEGQSGGPLFQGNDLIGVLHRENEYGNEFVHLNANNKYIWDINSSRDPIYMVYNPNSGEHLLTSETGEYYQLKQKGWNGEGAKWISPVEDSDDEKVMGVYRLYNPNAGDHHYTVSEAEKNMLVGKGWRDEGVKFFVRTEKNSKCQIPIYRLYNPNAESGAHHFTKNLYEVSALVALGWRNEGIAWYVIL